MSERVTTTENAGTTTITPGRSCNDVDNTKSARSMSMATAIEYSGAVMP